jgi:hypothetical protein
LKILDFILYPKKINDWFYKIHYNRTGRSIVKMHFFIF